MKVPPETTHAARPANMLFCWWFKVESCGLPVCMVREADIYLYGGSACSCCLSGPSVSISVCHALNNSIAVYNARISRHLPGNLTYESYVFIINAYKKKN